MRNKHLLLTLSFFLVTPFQFTIGMDQKKPPYTFIKEDRHQGLQLAMGKNGILAMSSPTDFELFDTKTRNTILQKNWEIPCYNSMAFNHNGTRFALAKCYTRSFFGGYNDHSTIEIYDIKTGDVIFSKERPAGEISYVAFHPMDDNFLLSYKNLATEAKFINAFFIHSINNPKSTFVTELHSPHKGAKLDNIARLYLTRLKCYPKKNSISLKINNMWHTIDNCFLTNEKIFLIHTLLKTNVCPDLNKYILALITKLSLANSISKENPLYFRHHTITTEYSPSGDYIAMITPVYGHCDFITINNSTTQPVTHELPHSCRRAIAFHPNEKIFATIDDLSFQYRSIESGEEIPLPLDVLPDDLIAGIRPGIVFSEDGKYAYISYDNKVVQLLVPENVINFKG